MPSRPLSAFGSPPHRSSGHSHGADASATLSPSHNSSPLRPSRPALFQQIGHTHLRQEPDLPSLILSRCPVRIPSSQLLQDLVSSSCSYSMHDADSSGRHSHCRSGPTLMATTLKDPLSSEPPSNLEPCFVCGTAGGSSDLCVGDLLSFSAKLVVSNQCSVPLYLSVTESSVSSTREGAIERVAVGSLRLSMCLRSVIVALPPLCREGRSVFCSQTEAGKLHLGVSADRLPSTPFSLTRSRAVVESDLAAYYWSQSLTAATNTDTAFDVVSRLAFQGVVPSWGTSTTMCHVRRPSQDVVDVHSLQSRDETGVRFGSQDEHNPIHPVETLQLHELVASTRCSSLPDSMLPEDRTAHTPSTEFSTSQGVRRPSGEAFSWAPAQKMHFSQIHIKPRFVVHNKSGRRILVSSGSRARGLHQPSSLHASYDAPTDLKLAVPLQPEEHCAIGGDKHPWEWHEERNVLHGLRSPSTFSFSHSVRFSLSALSLTEESQPQEFGWSEKVPLGHEFTRRFIHIPRFHASLPSLSSASPNLPTGDELLSVVGLHHDGVYHLVVFDDSQPPRLCLNHTGLSLELQRAVAVLDAQKKVYFTRCSPSHCKRTLLVSCFLQCADDIIFRCRTF